MRLLTSSSSVVAHVSHLSPAARLFFHQVAALLLTPMFKSPGAEPDSVSVFGSLVVQSCMLPGRGLVATSAADLPPGPPSAELASKPPTSTVVQAFLALPQEFLLKLAMDNSASRIFDAFLQSPCNMRSERVSSHLHAETTALQPAHVISSVCFLSFVCSARSSPFSVAFR